MKHLTKLAVASILVGVKVLLIVAALIIVALSFFHVIDEDSRVSKLAENFIESQTGIDVDVIEDKKIINIDAAEEGQVGECVKK